MSWAKCHDVYLIPLQPEEPQMTNFFWKHRGYRQPGGGMVTDYFEDGWYRTGDLGYIDDHGYLLVYDRIKDIIKYKGYVRSNLNACPICERLMPKLYRFQVAPSELERLLLGHPLVDEAIVIGIWNEDEATEVPRAFVTLKNKFSSNEEEKHQIAQSIVE